MARASSYRDPNGRHIRVYSSLLNSPAYRVIGFAAKALFFDLRDKLTGTNNGTIVATLAEMRHKGWNSTATLAKALYELRAMGFIAVTAEGGLKQGRRVPSLYRFTDLPVFDQPRESVRAMPATFDFMRYTAVREAERGLTELFGALREQGRKKQVPKKNIPVQNLNPSGSLFRYVKTKDQIESKARKPAEIKQLYQDIVAAVTLRTLHELFEADQVNALSRITFNGMIDTHDPASGKEVRVPVVSVRAPKETFLELRLEKVEKIACLKNLGAQVSARPDELLAIKPIVEFDMIDKRFIDQGDVLTGLESRPNLLDLTPGEFEILVSNLFGKMGLETKLTRSSRDGGVDAVAYDTRPILGGKVVIQAKRYKDTVGVSAVRDLFGTMMNEGANKGILVCTSGYGTDAYNFCKDKPIELIDGGGLLYLLREHAGIEARIAA